MFIRTKTTPYNKTKVQIVRSVREGDKIRQKMVRHVGTAGSDEELRQLRVLGETIIERLAPNRLSPAVFIDSQTACRAI